MSIRRAPALLAMLAAAFAMSACRPSESLEGQAKDAKIQARIKGKLASEVGASTLTAITVNVTSGVATLAGPVHSAEESSKIETVTRGVEGVTDVKNALQILAPQESITPQQGASGMAMTPPAAATAPPAVTSAAQTPPPAK